MLREDLSCCNEVNRNMETFIQMKKKYNLIIKDFEDKEAFSTYTKEEF